MPHAAFYVVQQTIFCRVSMILAFQCRTQHFMWCNPDPQDGIVYIAVSMPHAAFYVVQPKCSKSRLVDFLGFNAARSILCGATTTSAGMWDGMPFQCRTQHFMWCNSIAAASFMCVRTFQCRTQHFMWCNTIPFPQSQNSSIVSMPHAAFYVVQQLVS